MSEPGLAPIKSKSLLISAIHKLRHIEPAKISLGLAILFSPFRYRFILVKLPFPPIYQDFTDMLLLLSDIFLIITLLLWLRQLARQRYPISTGPIFIFLPLTGLLIISLVSALFSTSPALSIFHWLRLLLSGGLYLYIVNEIKSLSEISWAVASMIIIQATVAVGQVLGQSSLGLKALGELELDPSWSGISIVWADGERSLRAYGLSDHPNILGGLLAFALILLTSKFINTQSSKKVLLVSIYISGALALFLSFSTAAWLSFFIGLLLIAILVARKYGRDKVAGLASILVACLLVMAPFVRHNASYLGSSSSIVNPPLEGATKKGSTTERQTLNMTANEIFSKNALTGVGVGSYVIALRQEYPSFLYNYQPPPMVLLAAAAETGIFGALFISIILTGPWLTLWLQRKQMLYSIDFIVVSGALAAISIIGLFEYYPWLLTPGRFWLWLIIGLWSTLYMSDRKLINND